MEPTNEQIESEFDKHAMAELKEKATQLYLTRFQSKRLDEWAKKQGMSRVQAFEMLLAAGIASKGV